MGMTLGDALVRATPPGLTFVFMSMAVTEIRIEAKI